MSLHSDRPASALGPKSDVVAGARDLLLNKHRRARGQFLVEGPQGVEAALAADLAQSLFVTDWNQELAVLARKHSIRVNFVTPQALEALTETITPQGVVAVCKTPSHLLEDVLASKPASIAICVGVSDPGNLGTIIRTAAAMGVGAVVTTVGSVDAWSGKVVRATAGTFASVPVIAGIDDAQLRAVLTAAGYALLATTGNAQDAILDAPILKHLASPHAWLLGNEAHGLSDAWLDADVNQVRIPMHNEVESLNVSSAAAMCFFVSQFSARFSS